MSASTVTIVISTKCLCISSRLARISEKKNNNKRFLFDQYIFFYCLHLMIITENWNEVFKS